MRVRSFFESGSDDVALWLDRAQRGDARAWGQIVDRFQNLVYSVARRTGLNSDDAGDVFQATFLALYRSLDRIERPEALPKWLSVAAARESLRVKRVSAKYADENELAVPLDQLVADEDASAEELALIAEDADFWRRSVELLGGRCEQLLGALYFEELSYEDIVDQLGIPMGAIGPTRTRCLEKLRKVYQTSRGSALDS
jgi:RNA polymerase sigma factor (sigma-70 family)